MAQKATATKTALEPVSARSVESKSVFEEFDRVYNAIARRAFELFEGNGRNFGYELDDWLRAESEFLHPVKLNITEAGDALVIEAEVPGFTAKDLDIQIEGRRLTISGKRESSEEQKKGKSIFQEHRSNEILRVVDLPTDVDVSKATATLKNGIVGLQLPKSAKAQSTRIDVKVA
jgi:HSP20 family protein